MKETSNICDDNVCTASSATASASLFDSSNNNNSNEFKSRFKLNVKRVGINEPSDACTVQSDHNYTSMREAKSERMQAHQHFCAPDNYIHNDNMKSTYVDSNSRNAISSSNDKLMAVAEANAPMRYGGAIVRISDLRARGEIFLESGLNLRSVNKRLREEYKPCDIKENNNVVKSNYVTGHEQASLSRSHHNLGNVNCSNTSQQYNQRTQYESSKSKANNFVNDGSTRDGLEDVSWTNRLDEQRQEQKVTRSIKENKKSRKRRVSRSNVNNKRQNLEEANDYVNEGCALSEGNSNYRWYTVKGRRRLVVNGKTYRGKAAHSLWNKLKKIGTQTTRQTSSTLTSNTYKRNSKNNAKDIGQPKIVRASEIYSHSSRTRNSEANTLMQRTLGSETSTAKRIPELQLTTRAPTQPLQVKVPLRPSALELLRMPKLPLRSGTFDEVGKQKQNNATDEYRHIRAKNELPIINKINYTSNNTSKRYCGDDRMTVSGTREVISVIESDDEVNSTIGNNPTEHNTLTSNMQTQNSADHETELESIDSFSSTWDEGDNSICSSYDEKESKRVSDDSISVCSDRSSHNDDDEDNVVANTNNLEYAGTNDTESSNVIRESINTCENKESQVGGQEVIEYDGWVYPADVFAAMQEAKLNDAKTNSIEQSDNNRETGNCHIHNSNITLMSELANITPNAARQACAGLEIIGCQKGNELTHAHTNREISRVHIQLAQPCTVPVLVDEDLYTNHDVFDCLDSRELAGLFETGDEVGGVRYSAL